MKRIFFAAAILCGLLFSNSASAQVVGDINGDGVVNSIDMRLIQMARLGLTRFLTPQGLTEADTNGDGRVDATDFVNLARSLSGTPVLFRSSSPDRLLMPGETIQLLGRNLTAMNAEVFINNVPVMVTLTEIPGGLEFQLPLNVQSGMIRLTQQNAAPQMLPMHTVPSTLNIATKFTSVVEGGSISLNLSTSEPLTDVIEVTLSFTDDQGNSIAGQFEALKSILLQPANPSVGVFLTPVDDVVPEPTVLFSVGIASVRRGPTAQNLTATNSVVLGATPGLIALEDNDNIKPELDLDLVDQFSTDYSGPLFFLGATPLTRGVAISGAPQDMGGLALTIDSTDFTGRGFPKDIIKPDPGDIDDGPFDGAAVTIDLTPLDGIVIEPVQNVFLSANTSGGVIFASQSVQAFNAITVPVGPLNPIGQVILTLAPGVTASQVETALAALEVEVDSEFQAPIDFVGTQISIGCMNFYTASAAQTSALQPAQLTVPNLIGPAVMQPINMTNQFCVSAQSSLFGRR